MQDWCLSLGDKIWPFGEAHTRGPPRQGRCQGPTWVEGAAAATVLWPELCYAGTEPVVGGGHPSPDLRKQTGRRAGSSPPYLLGRQGGYLLWFL